MPGFRKSGDNCFKHSFPSSLLQTNEFQDDLYPPCPAGKPALAAEEWFAGKNCDPMLVAFSGTGLKEVEVDTPESVRSRLKSCRCNRSWGLATH